MNPTLPPLRLRQLEARNSGPVLELVLKRPEAANALNTTMAEELLALFSTLRNQPEGIRCLLLTGSGSVFCAGADLKERDAMNDEDWHRQHSLFEKLATAVTESPLPMIAAVNGAAVGGGCELALMADFIYAAEGAFFALPETSLGIIPGMGGTQRLPRAVGPRRARELILTGRRFSAVEACAWGMVNAVFPPDALLQEARSTAKRITAMAPLAIAAARRALKAAEGDMHSACLAELAAYRPLVATGDRREGVRAFREKRVPKFSGS